MRIFTAKTNEELRGLAKNLRAELASATAKPRPFPMPKGNARAATVGTMTDTNDNTHYAVFVHLRNGAKFPAKVNQEQLNLLAGEWRKGVAVDAAFSHSLGSGSVPLTVGDDASGRAVHVRLEAVEAYPCAEDSRVGVEAEDLFFIPADAQSA